MAGFDVVIAGVGGQGTVLASKLLAYAAMQQGLAVRTAETIGMAQRGGSVLGFVRIGQAASPLVPQHAARVLIGFEPGETVRALPYLAAGGTVVTATRTIVPATATLSKSYYDGAAELDYLRAADGVGKLVVVDTDAVCGQLGSARVLNVALLGAAAASIDDCAAFASEALLAAVRALVKPQFVELNEQAFSLGAATTA
jgi:indolepyruvate ferredoxin oxidoreductase beta subunit